MKVALIPPIKELDKFEHPDKIHMALAHISDPLYRRFFVQQKINGEYVILDNGAHELRTPLSPQQLLVAVELFGANELVMPDVPYDSDRTIELVAECFNVWLSQSRSVLESVQPRLMLVAQGSTIQEWRTCLFALVLKWERISRAHPKLFNQKMPVLGLPAKYHLKLDVTLSEMLEHWLQPLHERGYDVHLLGWRSLWGLNDLAVKFPWVRSIDSAKPFVYGRKGIMFDPMHEKEPAHEARPDDYFDWVLTEHQREVSAHNVGVWRRLGRGIYRGYKI